MGYNVEKVLEIAEGEVGYLEKASNSQLDDKTANAGRNNYTKYARDLAAAGYYQSSKQGFAWCDMWFDWVHYMAAGKDAKLAQEVTCQSGPYGAGCTYSARYYKQAGRFYTTPKVGDQIFFGVENNVTHTGLVYKVDSNRVYTIEGNTSGASGVVANGGGVCKKSYLLSCNKIYGYGRPKYDVEVGISTTTAKNKIDTVAEVQKWLNTSYSAKLDVDNEYGPKTKKALIKVLQKALGVEADGYYGPKTNAAIKKNNLKKGSSGEVVKALQGLLVCNGYADAYVDGSYGNGTFKSVKSYQKKKGLTADGIAGSKTLSALCK